MPFETMLKLLIGISDRSRLGRAAIIPQDDEQKLLHVRPPMY
jgi:hypothetical protein